LGTSRQKKRVGLSVAIFFVSKKNETKKDFHYYPLCKTNKKSFEGIQSSFFDYNINSREKHSIFTSKSLLVDYFETIRSKNQHKASESQDRHELLPKVCGKQLHQNRSVQSYFQLFYRQIFSNNFF
jgi:hypothetical protein